MYKPCQISSIQTDSIVPKLRNTETAHHQLSLNFEMPPGVLPMPSWCHLLPLAPQGWSPVLDASLSSPWRLWREGWPGHWGRPRSHWAVTPQRCGKAPTAKAALGSPSPMWPSHAGCHHSAPRQRFAPSSSPSKDLHGAGEGHRAHLPPGRSRPSTPSENKSVRKSPSLSKKIKASLRSPTP